jgi:hypothetical protein
MKFANFKINIGIKSMNSKYIVAFIIFIIGIGMLLYNIYIQSFQTSLIESFGIDMMGDGDDDGSTSKIVQMFSSFFERKCLPGCVMQKSLNKTKCNIDIDNNNDDDNNPVYNCPWICDTKSFDEQFKSNPELQRQLGGYKKCSPDTEGRDCGSCVPQRQF